MANLAGTLANAGGDEDVYAAFQQPSGAEAGGQDFLGTLGGATANPLGGNPLGGRHPPPSQWGGAPPGTGAWGGGAPPGSQWGGNKTGAQARCMTSNRGTGFNGAVPPGGFDPLNQSKNPNLISGPAPPLQKRSDNSPEEQCQEIERRVNELIEESAMHAMRGDASQALEKAKEAGKKERQLCKQRDQLSLSDQNNADLTSSVHFNLAVQYQRNGLFTEALNTYSLIVRNKSYHNSGRLRVNMGNIYMEQKKYLLAIKMYRLSLEEIPPTGRDLRFKIMRNIGNAFVKMGQYKDAVGSYEAVVDANPDVTTAFNLLLCYYALGEVDKMKRTFSRLLTVKIAGYTGDEDDEENTAADDVLVADALKADVRERRKQYLSTVTQAARLIAPVLDKDWRVGFDYAIEQLRHYEIKDASSRLASELEMCKALNFLKFKKYKDAIEGLKAFEKKDQVLRAKAATNLSYLYFLEGDYDSGEKYADMSVDADRYNAKALVNKGNFQYVRGEWEKAKQLFTEARKLEPDCFEAIYNLGLSSKQLGQYDDALNVFKQLQSTMNDNVEVIYQIADLYDIMSNPRASEWFNRLIGRVPTDPNVLARLGLLNAKEGDESQAFHYYLEAYRYYQVNMDVISWLGAYFVKNEVYDKAMQFFERAAQIQPHEVKWQLMVASCHRRRGEYPQAKRMYEDIHRRHPENMECLRYLVHLCKDSGLMEEANEWFKKIKRLEAKLETDKGSAFQAIGEGTMNSNADSTPSPRQEENPASERRRRSAKERKEEEDEDDEVHLPGV